MAHGLQSIPACEKYISLFRAYTYLLIFGMRPLKPISKKLRFNFAIMLSLFPCIFSMQPADARAYFPIFSATATPISDTLQGSQSLPAVLTVTNLGWAALDFPGQVLSDNPDFAVVSGPTDTCSNGSVAPSETCSVEVIFNPTGLGYENAIISFPDYGGDTFTLNGFSASPGSSIFTCTSGNYTVKDSILLNGRSCSGTVELDNSVNSIGSAAFLNSPGYLSLTLDSNLVEIAQGAFMNSNLGTIVIDRKLQSIGDSAFQYDSSLSVITFPSYSQLTHIGAGALYNVSVENLTLPVSLAFLGSAAIYSVNPAFSLVYCGLSSDVSLELSNEGFTGYSSSCSVPNFTLSISSHDALMRSEFNLYTIDSTGGTVALYTISPVLPSGLVLDQNSGLISGKPLTITPDTNYELTGTNSAGSYIQRINFATIAPPATHTITVTSGPNGSITPSTLATVEDHATPSFTLTPATGYKVKVATVDGEDISSFLTVVTGEVRSFRFSPVVSDHSIVAEFAQIITELPSAPQQLSPSPAPPTLSSQFSIELFKILLDSQRSANKLETLLKNQTKQVLVKPRNKGILSNKKVTPLPHLTRKTKKAS